MKQILKEPFLFPRIAMCEYSRSSANTYNWTSWSQTEPPAPRVIQVTSIPSKGRLEWLPRSLLRGLGGRRRGFRTTTPRTRQCGRARMCGNAEACRQLELGSLAHVHAQGVQHANLSCWNVFLFDDSCLVVSMSRLATSAYRLWREAGLYWRSARKYATNCPVAARPLATS